MGILSMTGAGQAPMDGGDGDEDVGAQLQALQEIEQMLQGMAEKLEDSETGTDKGTDTPDDGSPQHNIGSTDGGEGPGQGDDELQKLGTGRLGSGQTLLGQLLGR